MNGKKNILIVAGGYSNEWKVSLKSAKGIYEALDKERYNAHIAIISHDKWDVTLNDGTTTPINKNNFSYVDELGTCIFPDLAYVTIHGSPGEDGLLEGYFDMLGIPYSCAGALTCGITANKFVCVNYLKSLGIKVAESIRFTAHSDRPSDEEIGLRLGWPLFVKPSDGGGSSFGVSKVYKASELKGAIKKVFAEGSEVMIESLIEGTEVTCGCYKTDEETVVFPITEIVTSNEFFDFDAKYNGKSKEITPARLPKEIQTRVKDLTLRIYDYICAKGLIRVDYIIPSDGRPVLLEVNITPGMTDTSFIPQQIRAAGMETQQVLTNIIENVLKA